MSEEQVQRRLAAILAADVVGFSRLMEANEEATLAVLRQNRRELLDPTVARYRGRIFKVAGDGFLIEFPSVVDAIRCAMNIQASMPARNSAFPDDRHLRFRMGVHVGDVIIEGDDVYGEGVNIASRLEGLAPPGGIACSDVVRNQISNKLETKFHDQGQRSLKNIAQAVRVYFVESFDGRALSAEGTPSSLGLRSASVRPSIAVLPFQNMSNDLEQEFFSDGITEDIITDLSKASGLQVLSRNTVFTLKGKAQNLQQVARQLGVQFLLEGSVRKAGNRVRVTAQLIDGATDSHVWAERYDRDLSDIFALQDELTRSIVDQLKVTLLPEEQAAIAEAPTRDVLAYTSYLRARQIARGGTRLALLQARQLFLRALELDPNYSDAYVGVANCASYLKSYHGDDIDVRTILETAEKALALDPMNAGAFAAKGNAYSVVDARAESETAFNQALDIDPNNWEALYHFGRHYTSIGAFEKAIPLYIRAMEVQPDDYESVTFLSQVMESLGRVAEANKYAEIALKRAEQALRLNPENSRPAQLIANIWITLGEDNHAKEWIQKAFEIDPEDNHVRYNAACVYARMGDFDKAFDLLEAWAPNVAQDSKLWFTNDPDFSTLRSHPRYESLLKLVAD